MFLSAAARSAEAEAPTAPIEATAARASAANVNLNRLVFICAPFSRLGAALGGRGGRVAALPLREHWKPRRLVDGREANQAVDDPAEGSRLAELDADDGGDEVPLGDGNQPPVEPPYDEERPGDQI